MSGVPGLGKTRLVRVFSQQLGLSFGRIQYTPDLLPSDITGSEILQTQFSGPQNTERRYFEFVKGPIFHHLILADEINRASPRTQAAMLEAMEEKAVTYSGHRYDLPQPFMVCATQNPLEFEGTYPLPEAQLDRFMLCVIVDYPSHNDELAILRYHHDPKSGKQRDYLNTNTAATDATASAPPSELCETTEQVEAASQVACEETPICDLDTIMALRHHAYTTQVSGEIYELVNHLIRSSRQCLPHPDDPASQDSAYSGLRFGAGPRGGLGLIASAKARALLRGEHEVRWRHVRHVAPHVLRHRISLSAHYQRLWQGTDGYISALLDQVEREHQLTQEA